jgi:hypothetical protein
MRQRQSPRSIPVHPIVRYLAFGSALTLFSCVGETQDEASPTEPDGVERNALSAFIPVTDSCRVTGGAASKYNSGDYHYIYTVGADTATVACPILGLPKRTLFGVPILATVTLTDIEYIDQNPTQALTCQLHSQIGSSDVYSGLLTSTDDTHPILLKFSDGLSYTLYQTTGSAPLLYLSGSPVELVCTLVPGTLLSWFGISY